MTDVNEPGLVRDVHERLSIGRSAAAVGQAAAARYLRRYLLGLGVGFTAWLLALTAITHWFSTGTLSRAILMGVTVALLVALAVLPAASEPVRARLSPRSWTATVAGGALVFAVPAALAQDFPIAGVIGSLVLLAYWSVCALWFSRAR